MPNSEFVSTFQKLARQLAGDDLVADWVALAEKIAETGETLTAEDAASWANLGFMPREAEDEMASGVTWKEIEHRENPQRAHIWRGGKRIA